MVPFHRIERARDPLKAPEEFADLSNSRPISMCYPKAFRDINKPVLKGLSPGSESISSFEDGDDQEAWADNVPGLPLRTKSKSRAIPIPLNVHGTKPGDEHEITEQAKERYNLATWNMYERIVKYRQRNPVGGLYSQGDIVRVAKDNTGSHEKELEPSTSYNPDIDYYDMEEEIFDMEI